MANIPIKWLFNGVESLQNHLKTNPSFWMRILTQMLVPAWYEYLERCFFLSKPSSCIGVKKYEPMILVVFHRNPSVMVYHFIPTFRWVFHHPLQTLNNQGPFKQGTFLHNLFAFLKNFLGAGSGHPNIVLTSKPQIATRYTGPQVKFMSYGGAYATPGTHRTHCWA